MHYALHVPNLSEPAHLVDMGVSAEDAGWDGFLLWDHVFGGPSFPVPVSDPWVVLGALAVRTQRIRLGTAVTPLARRRPQKVARETVTVDRLSLGRMTLGVGLGKPLDDEYRSFGETTDPVIVAARLDEALDVLVGLWSGGPFDHHGEHFKVEGAQFLPAPVQQPRIPIWVACEVPHRSPLARAARFDGIVFTAIDPGGGVQPVPIADLELSLEAISRRRGGLLAFDVAVVVHGLPPGDLVAAYRRVGVTWLLVTGWADELSALASLPPGPGG